MKKNYVFFLALSFFVFISCKKKNETKINSIAPGVGTGSVYKIKTIKNYYPGGDTSSTEYYYDSAGRLTKTKSNDGSNASIVWTNDQVVYTILSSSNTVTEKLTYNLNASGRATDASGTSYSNNIEETFMYNADGYIANTGFVGWGDTTTATYTITDGNTTGSVVKYSNPPSENYTSVTEFYTDKVNTIGRLNIGFNISGKPNKNLEKVITTTLQNGSVAVTTNIYEFDSRNRVIEKISNTFGSTSLITLYTYY